MSTAILSSETTPTAPPLAQPTSTKQVRYRTKDGTIKTYTYDTIGGLSVQQYQKNYSKSYYEPRVRIRKYKKLPDEAKKLAFRLRSFAIGCGRIAKIINTDARFPTVYVGEGTIELLLRDADEEAKFGFKPTF